MKKNKLFLFVALVLSWSLFAQNNPISSPASPAAKAQVQTKLTDLENWSKSSGYEDLGADVVAGFKNAIGNASATDLVSISDAIHIAGLAGGDNDYSPNEFLGEVLDSVNSGLSWQDSVYDTSESFEVQFPQGTGALAQPEKGFSEILDVPPQRAPSGRFFNPDRGLK